MKNPSDKAILVKLCHAWFRSTDCIMNVYPCVGNEPVFCPPFAKTLFRIMPGWMQVGILRSFTVACLMSI